MCLSLQAILRELSRERRPVSAEERPYEVPFDKRAMDAVLDAINAGILPAMKVGNLLPASRSRQIPRQFG